MSKSARTFFIAANFIASLLMSVSAFAAGIAGSAHDFRNAGWSAGQVCLPCHTPHGANANAGAPLWSHALTSQTFTLYSSNTLNAAVGQPDGSSKLCLSCHDGTIALDSFRRQIGKTKITKTINADLHDTHPISFVYDSTLAQADGRLNDPATTGTPLGRTINKDLLSKGRVQCSSCHDVHGAYNNEKLLKLTQVGGTLCVSCHNLGNKHDFTREAWSQGKTCAACHADHSYTRWQLPPGAATGNLTDLTADEQAALLDRPANKLCYECHRTSKDSNPHVKAAAGGLAASPQALSMGLLNATDPQPCFRSGSSASSCIRVISNGSAITGKNCLECHDLHSTADKLLRPEATTSEPSSQ